MYLKLASGKSKTKIHFCIEIVTFIVTREAETIKLTISLLEGYLSLSLSLYLYLYLYLGAQR